MTRNYTQEQVNAGVVLLNERNPEWFKNVNIDTLDMGDDNNNLISQVYGTTYEDGAKKLMGAKKSKGFKNLFADKSVAEKGYVCTGYGFQLLNNSTSWNTSQAEGVIKDFRNENLTTIWKNAIRNARGE